MPTAAQQLLIHAIVAAMRADPRIESLWLSGSLAAGTDDEWSDVDCVAVVNPEHNVDAVAEDHALRLGAIAECLHTVRPFPRLISAVTRDWDRFDLLFMTRDDVARQEPARLAPLFSRAGGAAPGTDFTPRPPGPFDVEATAREFVRVAGLGPGVLARGHYLVAVDGMQILRNLCIDLMLAETGHARADASPKRVESLLTDEQRSALRSLPPLVPEREGLIASQVALWRLFIPRAQALADARNAAWPGDFVAATRAWVRRSLGVELD